jgi:putative transposase
MNAPSFRLAANDALIIDGRLMRVVERDPRRGLRLKRTSDGEARDYANAELLALYFQRRLTIERAGEAALSPERRETLDRAYDSFDKRWIEEMLRRHEYVEACDRFFTRMKGDPRFAQRPESGYKRVAAIVARYRALRARREAGPRGKISAQSERVAGATLRSWRRQWIAAGRNLLALMPMHYKKGPRGPKTITGLIAETIEREVRERWLTLERAPLTLVYDAILRRLAEMRKTGLLDPDEPDPNEMAVRRWIKANIGFYEQTAAREGRKAADAKVRASLPGPENNVPLRLVEIDHTKLDIFLVNPEDAKRPRGKKPETKPRRPWLTMAIDAATRMIVGFHLDDEAPSWTSVMMTLRMAILPKDVGDVDAKSPWPVVGVPEIVKLDNGREFHSTSLRAAAAQLGIELRYCRPGSPHLKGKIERFFGAVARDFCAPFPGRSFANPQARGDYRAEIEAHMTLEQARKLFKLWLVDLYHNMRHSGLLGKTPLQRWEELSFLGVRLPPKAEDLVALIGLVVPRQIRRTGVEYLGLRYFSREVDALRLAAGERSRRWSIKVDPEDLSCVYVLDEVKGRWLVAPCLRPDWVENLTIKMWRQTCEAARAMTPAKERVRLATLLRARDFILAEAEKMGARPSVDLSPDDRRLFEADHDAPIFAVAREADRDSPAKKRPAKTKQGKGAPISQSAGVDLTDADDPTGARDDPEARVARAAAAILKSATEAPASSASPTDPAGPDGAPAAAAPRASRKRVPKAQPFAED